MSALDELLLALAGTPALPGARCRGRHALFGREDGIDGQRRRQAAAMCRRCPALEPCREWADSQRLRHLNGVIAGRLYLRAPRPQQIEIRA